MINYSITLVSFLPSIDNTVVIATVVPIVGSILTMILVGFTIVIVTYFLVKRNRPISDEVEGTYVRMYIVFANNM